MSENQRTHYYKECANLEKAWLFPHAAELHWYWQSASKWIFMSDKVQFCTGTAPGAEMSRRTRTGFHAGSGLKFRKIPWYMWKRECKLRGTPMVTWHRPHGAFRCVVLKCSVWREHHSAGCQQSRLKGRASVPVLAVTPLQWQWHL